AHPDAARKDREIRIPRRWSVRGALLRGTCDGSNSPRPPGMLLLDPEAPGALLRRRLRLGNRRCGQGGDMVRQVRVDVRLHAGGRGIRLLCRALSRLAV